MATSDEIKRKALELSEKTDSNSISPKEVGGIMHDLASLGENAIRNGGTLGIRKVYTSVSVMEADKNPKDFWGNPMKKGNLVLIYDGTTTGLDNNKIYVYMNPGWEFATYLDAGYPTRQEFSELGSEVNVFQNSSDAVYTTINGFSISNEGVTENANYSYTSPILLKKGECIVTSLMAKQVWALSKTDKDGTLYTKIALGLDAYNYNDYKYIATEDCYISICWRSASHADLPFAKIVSSKVIGDVIALSLQIEQNQQHIDANKTEANLKFAQIESFQNSSDAVYTTINGFSISSEGVTENANYSYTSPILLKKGECIVTSLMAKQVWALSKTDKDGTLYTKIALGLDAYNYNDYKYIATEDCYISICWRSASHADLPFAKIVSSKVMEEVLNLRGELEYICNFAYSIGTISIDDGTDKKSTNRVVTSYIKIDVPYILTPLEGKVSFRFYDENKIFISGTDWTNNVVSLDDIIPEGCQFVRIVLSYKDDRNIMNISESKYLCNVTTVNPLHSINELKELITEKTEPYLDLSPVWITGSYINQESQLESSSSYQYSKPMKFDAGNTIVLKTSGRSFFGISKVDGDGYKGLLLCKPDTAEAVVEYRYYLTEDSELVFCVKNTSEYSVRLYREEFDKTILSNSLSSVGNVSIVAAKEHHYSDGTYPIIEWFLLKEPVTNKFYYSKDLKSKSFLFGFKEHENYSFGIMPNGDIIAVRLAESLPLTSSESNRTNPFVIKASENWSVVHEIDFQDKLKPCGWLENCGFCALPNGDTMFTEYTRISVETCNVWKITGDPLNANNWNIKKSFVLSGEADAGLKHLHAVRNDPFTGFIYISTGDYEASSIYVSKDNGETFEPVMENNQALCRSLEITFDKDYAYYGNDSTLHLFVKAPRRSDGVIDLSNAQTITIPKTEGAKLACYGQAYIPEYNVCFVFDRQDGGGTVMSYPLYVVDLETLECHKVGEIEGLDASFGFRTSYSEWYPNDATIRLGFPFSGKAKNLIKVCGNKKGTSDGSVSINNLVVRIYKVGDKYSMKISTIYL